MGLKCTFVRWVIDKSPRKMAALKKRKNLVARYQTMQ